MERAGEAVTEPVTCSALSFAQMTLRRSWTTLRFFSKQRRHNTGRPWTGLNGTVVKTPHPAQVTVVSGRAEPLPFRRTDLHHLQTFGSWLKLRN